MSTGRGNSRTWGWTARFRRSLWRAKLTPSAPRGSWARSESWRSTAYLPHARWNFARQFDPVAFIGGLMFFAIMGLSAYAEWLAAGWLIGTLGG